MKLNEIKWKRPVYRLIELPMPIVEVIYINIFLIFSVLLFSLMLSLLKFNISYFLLMLVCCLVFSIMFYLNFYRYFSFDKVIYYEGIVNDTNILEKKDKSVIRNTVNKLKKRYIRSTYHLIMEDGTVLKVIFTDNVYGKRNRNRISDGKRVRIYTLPDNIYKINEEYIINRVLFTEILTVEQ